MDNYPLTDPFIRDFIFDEEQKEFLLEKWQADESGVFRAKVYNEQDGESTSHNRSCYHLPIDYKRMFDISLTIDEMFREWYPEASEDLWWAQFEWVRYFPGQQFKKHRDDNPEGSAHNRYFTCVTMIEKSDDLEGGKLKVWLPTTDIEIEVDLEPFETIMFPAWFQHEATEVKKGKRVILISWAGKKGVRSLMNFPKSA